MSTPSQKDIFREWLFHQKTANLSRRNFLANAGAGAAATVFLPSILALLTQPSIATAATSINPLVIFDCVGGGTFAREVLPLDRTLNFLSPTGYGSAGLIAGLDPKNTPGSVTEAFGAPMPVSGILARALMGNVAGTTIIAASALVQANVKVMTVCAPGMDDSTNPTICSNQASALAAALGGGLSVPSGLSDSNSLSGAARGGNSATIPGYKPAQANSFAAVQGLMSLQQGALSALTNAQLSSLVNMTGSLNSEQQQMLGNMTLGKELGTIATAAGQANIAKVANATAFDARTDLALATAYGITTASLVTAPAVIVANQVKLLTDSIAPVLVKSLPGFDYHDGTATTWKVQHQILVNQTIQMLNAFAAKGKSVMIHWNTDGATRNVNEVSAGDGGENHSSVILVLSMPGTGAPVPKQFQIGAFNPAGGADRTTEVAAAAANEGHAVFRNFAAFQGKPVPLNLIPAGLNPAVFDRFNKF